MAAAADIDRLIEEGLNRYGSGDLDGALLSWEEALAVDPENAQANSYVDYVRMNYEVLQTDSGLGVAPEDGAPFGIEDEPEYIIEITEGHALLDPSAVTGPAPMYMDPTDEGWFIEEEQTHELFAARTRSANLNMPPARDSESPMRPSVPRILEMEADEPPELELGPPVARVPSKEVSFDSATREYGADDLSPPKSKAAAPPEPTKRAGTNEFLEEPSSFSAESTPLGFGNLETEVKKRDLGFVQPTQGPARLEVRLRTPSAPPPSVPSVLDLELGGAGKSDADDLARTSRGMAPITRGPAMPATTTEDDLIKSLPSPRPRITEQGAGPARTITPVRGSQGPSITDSSRIPTRELPEKPRKPASPSDRAETRQGDDEDIALPSAATRDLGTQATALHKTTPPAFPPAFDEFAISAPTRELGLRDQPPPPAKAKRPASVYPDDDAPTRQSDARQIREDHATQKLKAIKKSATATGGASDGTRTDYVLPFDPIDARTAQILDAIEPPGTEPVDETKEDRTRRRISALIEKATAWSAEGELDRAVAAVDLALSEDPNAALAQKLIHRNRDAIMAIFQAFLGDLERQPQLARPLHELATAPISPRAAFLLSRIDGTLTIDEILDVSGMPRLEAYRHLCQLFLRGILR